MNAVSNIPLESMLEHSQQATTLLKILANQHRLMILCMLHDQELSVSDINELIPQLSQSALSQHLAQLREADLVQNRRDSQSIYYSLTDSKAVSIIHLLHDMYCGAEAPE